jgi:hypothetical protein
MASLYPPKRPLANQYPGLRKDALAVSLTGIGSCEPHNASGDSGKSSNCYQSWMAVIEAWYIPRLIYLIHTESPLTMKRTQANSLERQTSSGLERYFHRCQVEGGEDIVRGNLVFVCAS